MSVNNARRICKTLLVLLFTISAVGFLPFSIAKVRAQSDDIEAGIYPSEGTGATEIVIRFYVRNASIGKVDKADLFWDGVSRGLNVPGIESADGSYNYLLKVPSEPPLSDIGNHTIMVDSFVFNYGQVRYNFTFRITEFVPSPEFIALNTTYYSILANYTDLLNRYASLSANFSILLANYSILLNEHAPLISNYNSLSSNYNSLVADYNALSATLLTNYNSLVTNFNNLHSLYSLFLANYTRIVENQNSLSSNYNTLREDYASLESNYHDLKTGYNSIVGEQVTARNLSYVFMASTIVLAVTTFYLVFIKLKLPRRTR